jgi:FKBP-type peptidyl-prolyl cis-trans isomerase FklB
MHKTQAVVLTLFLTTSLLSVSANAQQASPSKPATSPAAQGARKPTQSTTAPVKKAPAPDQKTAAASLSTTKEKFSYAVGMNLGGMLKQQPIDIDPKTLVRGLQDILENKPPALTEEEAKAVFMQVQAEARKKEMEKRQVEGAANKKAGETFLTENKSKAGVVTLPDGMQYKILQEGTGSKPTTSDTVVCNYRGTLLDGTEFDSSYKRGKPATFPVSGVIKGWTEALQLMPVGSKWQLFIPSDLAYGENGVGKDIPPSATLIFEVELVSIRQEPPKTEQPKTEQPKVEPKPEEKK